MQANMSQRISFSKQLHKSHVSGLSRMHLPKEFCEAHLPRHSSTVILVDECEREYSVSYSVNGYRLLRGWKEFVCSKGLQEGDTLIFDLIDQCKFKVSSQSTHNGAETGQSQQVTGPGRDYPVHKSSAKEPLPANTKVHSTETYLVGPEGKLRSGMDSKVKWQCCNILRELMNHPFGYIFNDPVDPVALHIPDYFSVISEPMDLGTIKKKLDGDKYSSMEDFAADVRLTFSNAMLYNPPDHEVYKWANHFNGYVDKKWKLYEAKVKHIGPISADDDGQDSCQPEGEKVLDNKKEWKVGVDARARKNDRLLRGLKRRGDDKVVPKEKMKQVNINSSNRSTETNGSGDNSLDSSNDDENPLAHDSHGIKNSESGFMYKGFEDFKVHVNGETLDSEIPPDIRMKYYQLCCTRKKFIHDHIAKGVDTKLVVSMILKIVCIDDAIKVASISTSPGDLERMGKTIKHFQDLGMAVGSLHAKIHTLIKCSKEHEAIEKTMRVKVAVLDKERTVLEETNSRNNDEFIESVKGRRELIEHLEANIEALKEKMEKLQFVFNEVAGLTW